MQSYATWKHLKLCILKLKMFGKTLQMMLKKDSTHQVSRSEIDRLLPKGKNNKAIGLMKDELGGEPMTEFAGLMPKKYSYLMDDGSGDKKTKGIKKFVLKQVLKFEDYKKCLLNNGIISKSKKRLH